MVTSSQFVYLVQKALLLKPGLLGLGVAPENVAPDVRLHDPGLDEDYVALVNPYPAPYLARYPAYPLVAVLAHDAHSAVAQ